jgi:hypothetical protein
MSHIHKIVGSAIAIASLSACGGGGDSSAPPRRFAQTEVKAVATLGALAVEGSGQVVSLAVAYMGGLLEALSTDSGGSRSVDMTATCTTGTARLDMVKATDRIGLEPGDEITLVADRCVVAETGFVLSGTVKLKPLNSIAAAVGGAFAVSFESSMTGFSVTYGGVSTQYDGVANAVFDMAGGGAAASVSFAIPDGRTLSTTALALDPGKPWSALSIEYGPGTNYEGSDSAVPNSATRKLEGAVTVKNGKAMASMFISTPSTLSGTSTTGFFVATSGVLNAKEVDENLATSTTISGVKASVSGDADGDGSLEMVFDSSWSALTTL